MRIVCSVILVLLWKYNIGQSDRVKMEIKNIGKQLNSPYPDFAAVAAADGSLLLFTSRRPVTEKEIKKHKPSKEHIYETKFDSKRKKWSKVSLLPETVNQPGRNNSAIALSNDGQRMLLYKDDEEGNGDIYESVLRGDSWSTPVKLSASVNSDAHESSASYSPDGRIIYFVSNRSGGRGGRDIWYCSRTDDDQWGVAINIGEPINTADDEEAVFIHPDGTTLYFSSKGHQSMGGYDVFRSEFKKNGWSPPVNMGAPLNTPQDDVYFILLANGKTAYYTSGKTGGQGATDIYQITFSPLKTEKEKEKGPKLTLLTGIITDEETKEVLEANIEITDNQKNEILFRIKSNSSTGKYLVSLPAGKNYGIHVSATGYLFHSENFNIPDTAAFQQVEKNIELKKLKEGNKIVLNNIFYDFDQSTLRPESASELNKLVKLLTDNPSMKIELSSHTDSKGSNDYNQQLSQERAQVLVNYLLSKGIAKNRLTAKGYGETSPVATNDTEEGRQLNRRSEFKIIKN